MIIGAGNTPTINLGSGAGGAASFTIEGDNISGVITITTGTNIGTNAAFFTITLADNAAFPSVMITHLTSIGANGLDIANNLALGTMTASSNVFMLKGASLTMAALTPYKLSYINTGYKK